MGAKEYSHAAPINFGAERIEQISKASGIDASVRANAIDAARRQRHALIPLDPSNWRRLFVRNGRVLSALPELGDNHPLQRSARAETLLAVLKSLPFRSRRVTSKLSTDQELAEDEQTLRRPRPSTDQELAEGEQTLLKPRPTDQELAEGEQTVRLVRAEGGEAIFVPTDVAQEAQVKNLVGRTLEQFGEKPSNFHNR